MRDDPEIGERIVKQAAPGTVTTQRYALENESARRYYNIANGPQGRFLMRWLNRAYS